MDNIFLKKGYLFIFANAVLAAEPFRLSVNHKDIVCCTFTRQIFSTMFTTIHYQTICHSVSIEAVITTQLVCHIFKANFMTDLEGKNTKEDSAE